MSEMVQRVARAIAQEHFSQRQYVGAGLKRDRVAALVEKHWRNHLKQALAAIKGIREPTEDMERAGFRVNVFEDLPRCCDNPIRVARVTKPALTAWQAIIDAALK